jgi:hypothetical protein
VTEDATGDILECTLSLNEQDWTNVVETADGEIIFTDLIVKTYDADGNPVNATVEFSPDYRDKDVIVAYSAPNNQINHTTEWQVIADAGYLIGATYSVNDSTVISAVRSNVNVAAGEMKTVELTLTNDSSFEHQMPGFLAECYEYSTPCKFFEDIEEEPPGGDGVGSVLSGDGVGDGVGDGGGDGGISAAITLSVLAAAALLIILIGFWLFKLLAAVVGIDEVRRD